MSGWEFFCWFYLLPAAFDGLAFYILARLAKEKRDAAQMFLTLCPFVNIFTAALVATAVLAVLLHDVLVDE